MDHSNCTIAWVLPSSEFHAIAEGFFDEVYNHFSTPLRMTYSTGRVGRHDVVAASKTNDATCLHTRDLVDNLLGDFPFIQAGFLASVDATASTTGPIRVGDVVVGTKPNLQSAVVYFDAKQTQSQQRLVLTREPRRIPERVAMAIESVRTQKGRDAWLEALGETSQRNQRKAYRGAIGSSSEAFNDATIIDHVVSNHKILCFETTAASINSQSLVVVAGVSRHAGSSESPTSAAEAHGAVFSYLRCVAHYMSAEQLRIEPPLASYFTYTPFDLDRAYFRLLILHKGRKHDKISCSVFQACLPDRQSQEEKEINQDVETILPYEALSYCWGGDRLRNMITVDGKALFITDNLLDALQNLRRTEEDRILWVDTICIDQSNVEERGHQVGWMGELYRRAEEVLCWLGHTEHTVSHILALLEEFVRQIPRVAWKKWLITDDRWRQVWEDVYANQSQHDYPSQLKCLMAKEWFSRVWILQEIASARKALIGCSEGWISAKAFAIAPTLLDVRPSNQCQAVIDIMPGPTRRQLGRAQKTNICSLLWTFRDSQASDPRDRLYALLGLASDLRGKEGSIVADYTKSEEAVTEDILSYLYEDDTSISTTRQLGLARVQTAIPKLSGMALEKVVSERLDVDRVQEYMRRGHSMIWLTEGIARIAAQDICSGEKVVGLLLSERANVMVTEGLVEVIASSFSSACLRLLLEYQGQDIQVTSQIVKAAVENKSSGKQLMNLLLADQWVKFTDGAVEEVTMAAAGNESSGEQVMNLLLDRRGKEVKVTEEVVKAAAGNWSYVNMGSL
ncbi:ankyrin repeat and sam domain containing protein 6 [Colletotrichum chrysophilum]|uniref:Ankyrin repeat and sam domain containing protein 6 n=1 Tax=Colletotrichum chrysophilum TaxID=1836956 RepID=A0AAD9A7U0_9PEZI|nr:ankyrin repeat and sam domain containing protein 6 [Colletotrichum chrysophilum]